MPPLRDCRGIDLMKHIRIPPLLLLTNALAQKPIQSSGIYPTLATFNNAPGPLKKCPREVV